MRNCRGQILDMQSIRIRLPEEDLLISGQWKGYLIKGAGKHSSADTLVERTTGFVALATTTRAVVDSFAAVFNGEPAAMRKMMACDQGHEMRGHKIFIERTGLRIDSVDPHGPWQRGQLERQRSAAPVPLQKHRLIDLLPGRVECHCAVAQYASMDQD